MHNTAKNPHIFQSRRRRFHETIEKKFHCNCFHGTSDPAGFFFFFFTATGFLDVAVSSSVSLRSRLSVPECSVSLSPSLPLSPPLPPIQLQENARLSFQPECARRARRNHQCQPSTVPEAAAVKTLTGWRDDTREEGGKLAARPAAHTLCRAGSARKTAVRYFTLPLFNHYFGFDLEMSCANPRFYVFILCDQRDHWTLISALRQLAIQDTNVAACSSSAFFMSIFIHVSLEQM